MADTGNGASFSRAGFSVDIYSIEIGEASIGTIDISLLSDDTFLQKISEDLADAGSVTIHFLKDATVTTSLYTLLGGAAVSSTLTFPISNTSNTTAATIAGTALCTNIKEPDFNNNERQEASATFEWDGVTGPAFTAES